MNELLNLLN
jgi:hypothetical protein